MRRPALMLVLVLIAGLVLFAADMLKFAVSGTGSSSATEVFEVPSGASFVKITKQLFEKRLILEEWKFRVFAKFTGQESKVKKGEYLLNHGMNPQAILDAISSGKSIQYPITIPEGSNIYDIAEVITSRGFNGKEFLSVVKNPEIVQKALGSAAPSLEGYLFPETYNVTKFTTMKELAQMMVGRFNEVFRTLPVQESKLTKHEIVTLASVVEKETGAPQERPMIASVFYNRLDKGMPLQSDPTIIYGIADETGKVINNITREDITRPNRYNTYTVKRLPFGPICNPGRESLMAVLRPAVTENFYFVSKNDGTHVFTKTYTDHLKEVKAFQLNPAARQGKSWRDLKTKKR